MAKNLPSTGSIEDLLKSTSDLSKKNEMEAAYKNEVAPNNEKMRHSEPKPIKKPEKISVSFTVENYEFLKRSAMGLGVWPAAIINAMIEELREKYETPKDFIEADIYGFGEIFEEKFEGRKSKKKAAR